MVTRLATRTLIQLSDLRVVQLQVEQQLTLARIHDGRQSLFDIAIGC